MFNPAHLSVHQRSELETKACSEVTEEYFHCLKSHNETIPINK